MPTNRSGRNILFILVLLVFIPTAFYTVYELSTLNAHEQILSEMYSRQLDAILYSANEHATSVVTNWVERISKPYELLARGDTSGALEEVRKIPQTGITIEHISFSDTTGKLYRVPPLISIKQANIDTVQWRQMLQRNAWKLERLVRYLRAGYRKIEPLFLGDTASPEARVVMAFAFSPSLPVNLAAVLMNEEQFIRDVIGRKLTEIAGETFILGVVRKRSQRVVFATDETSPADLHQQKRLWLFPNYELGIRVKGTTIDELAGARTRRNLLLLLGMDLLLIAGVWFVYRAIKREMELARLKSEFVSNVSHELRTPLALIRMYGETLELGRVRSDEKRKEYYATIVKESERLTRLVNSILDFSKMEAGKKEYTFAEIQLNGVVRDVMTTYDSHLRSEGFSPIVELDDSLPCVRADAEAVAEALVNLIDNAVKYSGERKYLKVSTSRTNGACVVEVEDHGIGIEPQYRTRIFDKFYRVGSVLVHNTKGSGLGLALVRHIMGAHKGRVEVESEVGKGSVFRLVFPIPGTETI
ncbi:MAG TPA: ATP-binding protein [Bacteroidota bacterium]|nr:ATP-binding protein [Bacteroidota bacterium]